MTTTLSLSWCKDTTPEAFKDAADAALKPGVRSLLILACETDKWHDQALKPILQALTVPVFGGIFPRIIASGQCHEYGTLIVGLDSESEVTLIDNLSEDQMILNERLSNCLDKLKCEGILVFFDGLADNIESLVQGIYVNVGADVSVIGGGSGSVSFEQRPCLFTNQGLVADSALLVSLKDPVACGSSHGWQIFDGPYLVTQANENVISQLNYEPAFQLYQNKIKSKAGICLNSSDFFSVAKTFPLGLANADDAILVRDPIKVVDNSLVCVGKVPQNTLIYILKGDANHLIASAQDAANIALQHYSQRAGANLHETAPTGAIVFDCLSRGLFLGGQFAQELVSITNALGDELAVLGALSLGEICNSDQGPVELLNKSTVVALF